MESVSGIGRPCFIEDDDGLASLAGMEAGFSGSSNNHSRPLSSRSFSYGRRGASFKNLASFSPRSAGFSDVRFEDDYQQQPHFLESCFLCKKPLGENRDIFMYRGDTPFCSEECRQEQIEIDEAQDNKNWNLSSSMKTLRQKDQRKSSISPTKDQSYPAREGTVAAG